MSMYIKTLDFKLRELSLWWRETFGEKSVLEMDANELIAGIGILADEIEGLTDRVNDTDNPDTNL